MNTLKHILSEIKEINRLDSETNADPKWNGKISFNGIKRMIFGIWHDGENENGENMVDYIESNEALKIYETLISKYKDLPEISVFL